MPPVHCSDKEKAGNTLHRHITLAGEKRTYTIHRRIVDTIIGEMFFRGDAPSDDSKSDTEDNMGDKATAKAAKKAKEKQNALKLFTKMRVRVMPTGTTL